MRFQRGPHRIVVAPPTVSHPSGVGDVVLLEDGSYDEAPGWEYGGVTRTGLMLNGLGPLTGADDDPTADRPGHWAAAQIPSYPEDALRRWNAAVGRPVRIAFLWQVHPTKEILGHYFPMAVCQPFAVGTGHGECSTTPLRWNVGPHGYRRLDA